MKKKNSLHDYDRMGQLLHKIGQEDLMEFSQKALMFQTSKECRLYHKVQTYLNRLKSRMDDRVCHDYPKFDYGTFVFYRNNLPPDYYEKLNKQVEG